MEKTIKTKDNNKTTKVEIARSERMQQYLTRIEIRGPDIKDEKMVTFHYPILINLGTQIARTLKCYGIKECSIENYELPDDANIIKGGEIKTIENILSSEEIKAKICLESFPKNIVKFYK